MTPFSTFGRRWAALPYAIFARNPLLQSGGVQFPATQVPSSDANTLDDYEEGTFTPTGYGASTAGTATYTIQNGRYTKTGRQVFVEFTVGWSAHTGTGTIRLGGLPFSSAGDSTFPSFLCTFGSLTFTGVPMAALNNSSTYVEIRTQATGAAQAGIAMDTDCFFSIVGIYSV